MSQVSVIIPTFNRKEQVLNALESVFAQRDAEFEVLVIDDGSTDGTREAVESSYADARYFWQENAGPSAARNLGIQNARHDWIAFLDSDDIWLPGKLKAQADFFEEHPEVKICQTEEIWIRNGKRVNPMNKHLKPAGDIFVPCLELCLISPSAVMLHRSIFEDVGLFDADYPACEDYELWLRITSKYSAGKIDQPYIHKYGGHADQLSREFPAMDRFRIRALIKILLANTLNSGQEKAALKTLRQKVDIYLTGAVKRGKKDEAERLKSLYHGRELSEQLSELAIFFKSLNPDK